MEKYMNKWKIFSFTEALPSMTSSHLVVGTVSFSCLIDAGSRTIMLWVQPLPPDSLSTPFAGNTFLFAACSSPSCAPQLWAYSLLWLASFPLLSPPASCSSLYTAKPYICFWFQLSQSPPPGTLAVPHSILYTLHQKSLSTLLFTCLSHPLARTASSMSQRSRLSHAQPCL